jgi:pimeloyl-ACP methyl ester carboxylesterase
MTPPPTPEAPTPTPGPGRASAGPTRVSKDGAPSDPARPTVVLLHGLARTHHSLRGLQHHLERAGYPTWARTYPSRRLSIAAAADLIADLIARELPPDRPLAVVTHSLGGIVARYLGARIAFTRIVMMAPPNQGSRVARDLHDKSFFRWFFGPAGQEIGTPDQGSTWPHPSAPCAVIAGTAAPTIGNPTSWITGGGAYFAADQPNDGTLATIETRLPGMAAFATVDASHTWIMNHDRARELALNFLDEGTTGSRR